KVGGDGKGVLISTFLQMVPPEVEEVLGRSAPDVDVLSSSSSDNEEVKLLRQLEEEPRMRQEAEGRITNSKEGVIKKWFCLKIWWRFDLVWWGLMCFWLVAWAWVCWVFMLWVWGCLPWVGGCLQIGYYKIDSQKVSGVWWLVYDVVWLVVGVGGLVLASGWCN
ncbi:MAG: hypothetical protein O4859_12565, partial [Trichodesmium sp. St18_bin1]|nr:hypothetical protein [Trichodesmium sp. St18_bin1]